MSNVGRVFANRYELRTEVGHGGMADVYLARDRLLNRRVAVKVLSAHVRRRPCVRRAVPPRGAGRREPEPPEHRRGVRLGPRGRHVLHRHGVRQRTDAARRCQSIRHAAADGSCPHRGRHRRRARVRAPQRSRPPRREARERAHHAGGWCEGHRLRHRTRREQRHAHEDRRGARNRHVLLAGAGARTRARRALRRVLARRRALRDAHRCRALHRRQSRCRSRTSTCERNRCRRHGSTPTSRARSIGSCSPR